ncbi:hypothetical protein NBRC116584_36970 [Hydrogenophaga sp. 5NK40-0174]
MRTESRCHAGGVATIPAKEAKDKTRPQRPAVARNKGRVQLAGTLSFVTTLELVSDAKYDKHVTDGPRSGEIKPWSYQSLRNLPTALRK